jgi:hypothetical protein
MKRSTTYIAIAFAMVGAAWAQTTDATTTSTTVTSVTGAIKQLNYGPDGQVTGFLVGANILLTFPSGICGGIESLGVAGNSVTYSGTEFTATTGFETVDVTSFTNTTTKATYTAPTSNASTTYGPTSGTLKQLNYGPGGGIDGFLFTASGGTSSIFVSTGGNASSTLTTLLTVGATVSVTGTTSPSMSACSTTGTLEAVNPSSLTIGTQTVVFSGGGNHGGPGPGGPGGPGFGGPGGHH